MQITIEIPVALRQYCAGEREIKVHDPGNFPDLISQLSQHYPRLSRRIIAPNGSFYEFIGVFLNEKSLVGRSRNQIELRDGDVVSLIPAMAGG